MHSAVTITNLSFSWPDATPVLHEVTAAFSAGRSAIIGDNGSGKTTLLRLIAGELSPTSGQVTVHGIIGHLTQHAASDEETSVADLLGITPTRRALKAIEAGSVDVADYEQVGDDWDIESRALAELAALGLPGDPDLLKRPSTELSGGEATQVALAGARLAAWDVTLLDEPTNNLDATARLAFYRALETWPGVVILVSHDRDLLERVDSLLDLDPRGATSFTGGFSEYQAYKAAKQAAADQDLVAADAEIARAKRQAMAEQQRKQQRDRSARNERAKGNVSKGAADFFGNRAEKKAGAKTHLHAARMEAALETRAQADAAARTADPIRIDLPETAVAPTKQILRAELNGEPFEIHGPQRIHLTGDNGSGKSTLLKVLTGSLSPSDPLAAGVLGEIEVLLAPTVPVGFLTQRTTDLDRFDTALDAVAHGAPARTPQDARNLLARLQLRRDAPLQSPESLSGGERFRVALARELFADPAPQLLILDEPTNNLDLSSVEKLVQALESYEGALIVVTHDVHLARGLRINTTWHLPGHRDQKS